MNQTLSGIYLPGNSIIHRLDARVKLFSFLTLVIAALFANSWTGYLVMVAISIIMTVGITALIFILSFKRERLNLRMYRSGIRPHKNIL